MFEIYIIKFPNVPLEDVGSLQPCINMASPKWVSGSATDMYMCVGILIDRWMDGLIDRLTPSVLNDGDLLNAVHI